MNAWYHRIRLKIWHLANQKFCMFWVFAAEAATGVGFGITYPHRGSLASDIIYKVSYSTYCPSSCIVKSGARARVVNLSIESCLKSQGVPKSTLAFDHTNFASQIQLIRISTKNRGNYFGTFTTAAPPVLRCDESKCQVPYREVDASGRRPGPGRKAPPVG